jgi:two-component system NtrC family sensor kinase
MNRKDQETELQAELDRMRELMLHTAKLAEMGKLVASVAHELSQPLLGIKAFAQILERKSQDEFFSSKIRVIVQQAMVMEEIIDSLRRFTKRKSEGQRAIDLPKVVETAVLLFQERLRKSKVKVDVTVENGLPDVLGTYGYVQQIVVNLLSNAIDAIESIRRADETGLISVRFFGKDGRVVMRVVDTGPGVDKGLESKMFEAFFTTKGTEQGTGLGLSICKEILKLIGGEIRLMTKEEVQFDFAENAGAGFEVIFRAHP